jgi:tRNA(adenine34) deaminase
MIEKHPDFYMKRAVTLALEHDTLFGAVITDDQTILVEAWNTVASDRDPTAHAEVNAIRKLGYYLDQNQADGPLRLFTTCEPCPMCAAAACWAQLDRIYFGISIDTLKQRQSQIDLSCQSVIQQSPHDITVHAGFLDSFCRQQLLD